MKSFKTIVGLALLISLAGSAQAGTGSDDFLVLSCEDEAGEDENPSRDQLDVVAVTPETIEGRRFSRRAGRLETVLTCRNQAVVGADGYSAPAFGVACKEVGGTTETRYEAVYVEINPRVIEIQEPSSKLRHVERAGNECEIYPVEE